MPYLPVNFGEEDWGRVSKKRLHALSRHAVKSR